ncbi:glycine betaine/L-proline transporter ProP [Streptomyces sp. ODS28]|uniref:glycine betaine/L-proline transporter ProP n=1 Tax=Streptomyces sp. ODS28 TaxID=3136688 RepID=UPI0031F1656B
MKLPAPPHVRQELVRRLRRRGRPLSMQDVTVVDQPMLKRAVSAAALGNCMEWFDFGVYSYLAATIGKVFFPGSSPGVQVISAFATFAVAFLVRPLGGLFFGPLGDKIGRTKVLAATMLLMAVGTFAIGVLPTYAQVGLLAPILLLIARMVQGFSTGGEYGGATTFIAEYSPDRSRGFMGSWLDFGTFVGYALGSGMVTLLNMWLSESDMLSWGWRVPFLIAGPLGLIGLYLRLKLEDTPAFQKQLDEHDAAVKERETERHEFRAIFIKHRHALMVCIGLVLLYNVTNYMITAYLPTHLTKTLGRSTGLSDSLVLIAMVLVVVLITFVGRLSDRVGRRPVFLSAAIAQVILAVPAFMLIRAHGTVLPALGVLLLAALLTCFAAPSAATLPALFPTSIRYGAMGIGFNLSVAAFGGTTPLFTEALTDLSHDNLMPGYVLVVSGIIGFIAALKLRETSLLPLKGSQPQVSTEEEAEDLVTTSEETHRELQQEAQSTTGSGSTRGVQG